MAEGRTARRGDTATWRKDSRNGNHWLICWREEVVLRIQSTPSTLENICPPYWSGFPKGESIQITRRGISVAVLVPAKPQAKDPRQVMEQIRKLRKGNRLSGLSIRKLIEEGRRF
jgi:hypothetical protein